MFLKRIDVMGFKSFADKISLEFNRGMTAIVGPNGSGKSNITDAIRWVLGEQSVKSLRGAKLEDVIFTGSDSRRALNMAEVTLTLNNEDHFLPLEYKEVSITRRVYRSGDSDFLINKKPCRLKDIVDLFMDSGLGRESFSIISQGKVEEILSSKPEDRRVIFEEAAGVLKYKLRKKKAEQKLFETEENLARVQDIIYELGHQIEPLRIQASIANDYLQQKAQLETFELGLYHHDITALDAEVAMTKETMQQASNQEFTMQVALNQDEAALIQQREQLAALEDSLSSLHDSLLIVSEELEKLEGRKEVMRERKRNASKQKEQLAEQRQLHEAKQRELAQQIAERQTVVEAIYEQKRVWLAKLAEAEEMLATFAVSMEAQLEAATSQYFDLMNEQTTLKNNRHHWSTQLERIDQRFSQLTAQNQQLVDKRQTLQRDIDELTSALRTSEQAVSAHKQQVTEWHDEKRSVENVIANQTDSLYKAYQYLQQMKSRLETLEAMQQQYAGFFQGVKEVLQEKGRLPGIIGAVIELVKTHKAYETAIEVALGGAAQHVVVADEAAGRQAIQFLKTKQKGRATFLPLTVMKPKFVASEHIALLKGQDAFLGVASDCVEVAAEYRNIATNLLGNVIIAKTLEGANALARMTQYRYRVVTLEGDVVNAGGSMTGGSTQQKTPSVLGRAREKEELQVKLSQYEQQTAHIEQQIQAAKQQLQTIQQTMEREAKTFEQTNAAYFEQQLQFKQLQAELVAVNEQLALYDFDVTQLVDEREEQTEKLATLAEREREIEAQLVAMNEQIARLRVQREDEATAKIQWGDQVTEAKVQHAAVDEKWQAEKKALTLLQRQLAEVVEQLTRADEHWQLIHDESSASQMTEEELAAAITEKAQMKDDTNRLIEDRRAERRQLAETVEHAEREMKEKKRIHKQLQDDLRQREVAFTRLEMELQHQRDQLWEQYELQVEQLVDRQLTVTVEEARHKVKLLRRSIDELGHVNLGAIDEFARVEERYAFLTEQKDDLEEAKQTLRQLIAEMDEEMTKRFGATFAEIRRHFSDVFRKLFGGGRADLKLTDDSLLTAGVEIIAQPPGKKLQNLSLLSGGERAFTAIALLFAILQTKDVPFVVLDEVEAALDEANVVRFSQYVKQHSANTQFIVITHRKGTMEQADDLYGVTMQESGVSKLVSVRLEEYEEEKGATS